MRDIKIEGYEVKDGWTTIARFDDYSVQDANYQTIARINGDQVTDANYNLLARIGFNNQQIEGPNFQQLGTLDEAKSQFPGTPDLIAVALFVLIGKI